MASEPENLCPVTHERIEATMFDPERQLSVGEAIGDVVGGQGSLQQSRQRNVTAGEGDIYVNGNAAGHATTHVLEIGNDHDNENTGDGGSFFECNICMDMAKDPVITRCGHLFCWPCLYRWLYIHSDFNECPVCKGDVEDTDIIPIYGRGINSTEEQENAAAEPRLIIPPRPHGRRSEGTSQNVPGEFPTFEFEELSDGDFEMTGGWPGHHFSATISMIAPPGSMPIRIIRGTGEYPYHFSWQNTELVTMDFTQGDPSTSTEAEVNLRYLHMQFLRIQEQRDTEYYYFTSTASIAQEYLNHILHHSHFNQRAQHLVQQPPHFDQPALHHAQRSQHFNRSAPYLARYPSHFNQPAPDIPSSFNFHALDYVQRHPDLNLPYKFLIQCPHSNYLVRYDFTDCQHFSQPPPHLNQRPPFFTQPPPPDARVSFSDIAAGARSGNQAADGAVEMDWMRTLSASSSRGRAAYPRAPDVNIAKFPASRRMFN
ncbi:PREDICTED: uncharacterized protein LOC104597567 isoform X2 [Nelumbo nucifera]|nr:PREDICTED: uncharacterized protein LOC104597567 isoform X2 [Nelumbo nucifera]